MFQLHPMRWLFWVRGLCTKLKHVVAYFFTGNVTSFQLMPLFWKVVAVLETTVKLWVLAAVNDGASPNRKFFTLHAKLGGTLPNGLVYKTPNLFCLVRTIFFFADVPHLMKTARNCLYNSGSGSRSRYMWNDGQNLLFRFALLLNIQLVNRIGDIIIYHTELKKSRGGLCGWVPYFYTIDDILLNLLNCTSLWPEDQ